MSAHPEPAGIEPAAVTSGKTGAGMLVRLSLLVLLNFFVWAAWYATLGLVLATHLTASTTASSSFWERYTSTRLRRRSSARTRSRCFVWIVRGAGVFVSSLIGGAVFAATDRVRAAVR